MDGVDIVLVAGRNPLEELAGGHSSYVRVHARAWLRAGFAPQVFCVSRQAGPVETDFGVVHRVPSPFRPFRQLMVPGHGPLLASAVARFLAARPGRHVIHSFGVWGYAGVAASTRLRRRGVGAIPIVSSYTVYEREADAQRRDVARAHGLRARLSYAGQHVWKRYVVNHYERRGYEESALVLVNYESVRRLLLEHYRIEATCRKVPYTSESAFQEEPAGGSSEPQHAALAALRPSDAPLLVTVARHEPNKGLDVFLHALARLREAGVPFRACLVGAGRLLDAHRRLARTLGLGATTVVAGFVPDPRAYLREADVFVLPSRHEQSGSLALIEALQAGLPVVASSCDGLPEDVTDGHDALLVEPGDASALAAGLRRLLTEADLRQALGRRARETFERRFSADTLVAALRDIYAELGLPRLDGPSCRGRAAKPDRPG
jgi:glycosyltransferase involved in cell wall biosynthesis